MIALGLATVLALAAAAEPQPAAAPAGAVPALAPQPVAAPPAGLAAPAPASVAPVPAVAPVAPVAPGPPSLPPAAPAEGPDVELHVPRAEVAKLSLDVENLSARLDVDTSVARLVTIRAGVVATVQKLKAELEGVSAETHLVVRLNRVADIMGRALAAIDANPQLAGEPVAALPPAPPAAAPAPAVAVDAAAEPRPASSQHSTE